jgi:hypothetical protein
MIGEALVLGLLLVAAALYVTPPLLGREALVVAGDERSRRRAELETRRDETYAALKEADLDLRTGKLDEADHGRLRESLLAEAAALLRELDALESAPPPPGPGEPAPPAPTRPEEESAP